LKKILVGILIVCVTSISFAQDSSNNNNAVKKGGPRRQLATILFMGLGGAVLGLSTLSFYGQPQNYLGNIGIGFAAGVIVGTIYVTYKSATTHDYSDDSSQYIEPQPEQKFLWSPWVAKVKTDDTALGGQMALRF
jgi:hypothetical protein